MKMRTVFKLSSQKEILNGLLKATDRFLIISTSPPSIYGATNKPNHTTGIRPQA